MHQTCLTIKYNIMLCTLVTVLIMIILNKKFAISKMQNFVVYALKVEYLRLPSRRCYIISIWLWIEHWLAHPFQNITLSYFIARFMVVSICKIKTDFVVNSIGAPRNVQIWLLNFLRDLEGLEFELPVTIGTILRNIMLV